MKRFRIKITKISLRITLYFSVVILLLALAITYINIHVYSGELSTQIHNVATQKLGLITGKIDQNAEYIKAVHSVLINDYSVTNAFNNAHEEPSAQNIQVLTNLINNHPSIGSDFQSIIALGTEGEIYNPSPTFPAFVALTHDNPTFTQIKSDNSYFMFSIPNTYLSEYSNPTFQQRNNITLYAQYYDYNDFNHLGYLAINIRKSYLFSDIEDLAAETFSTTYIVDDQNQLIHQIGDLPYENLLPLLNSETVINYDNESYNVFVSHLSSYNRWRVITLFDRELIEIETTRLNRSVYLALLLSFILTIIASYFISQKITNPIREVVHSMDEFEHEKWPEPLKTKNEDEIKYLIEGYNNMLTSFIKLTDNMIGRHQENKRIELDLIHTQIGLLEAQINPHFIHNTLNSMNYLALSSGNKELSQIIESFNRLLRTSMAIDVSFVTIAQEIDNIKAYANIQNVRFEDAFEINYEIDPEASIGKIPKLILQPLVENSIIHGILQLPKKGHIDISVSKDKDQLYVIIKDDGIGMTQDMVKNLLNTKIKVSKSEHIGVHNVIDRIRLYYGDAFTFDIKSRLNEGTTITFAIPYED